MNIKEAKEEIKRSVEIYLDKNEFGEYIIPVSRQRPVFMVGAPGIGKTAIMQQIASELDIALVTYSMTHHTRQSVLGLPVIGERDYSGKQVWVSEYTMSEIITALYRVMKDSGKKEGILFLDEVNCVSETLAPAMLLFLQYKILGNQSIPEGWVVVTAGNPRQYNKSVKEFNVATLDRLKRINVTEDFSVWKEYAYRQGIHAAVITFLEINQQWFYSVRSSVDGIQYVTARGWEDLSDAMRLYEKKSFPVDRRLVGQYITDTEIARKFDIYYELYQKYRSDYQIEDILSGKHSEEIAERAQKARMDERFSLLGLLLEKLNEGFRRSVSQEHSLQMVVRALRSVKKLFKESKVSPLILLEEQARELKQQLQERTAANSITAREKEEYHIAIRLLGEYQGIPVVEDAKKDFDRMKKQFDREVKKHEKQIKEIQAMLEEAFGFLAEVWGNDQEMVFFLTELTAGTDSLFFINRWGCDSYFAYNQELLVCGQDKKLEERVKMLREV